MSGFFILAQASGDSGSSAGAVIYMVCVLIIVVVMVASMWKINTKAGKPGWAAIIPIYNIIVLLEIVGRPVWWIILFLIPVVSFVVSIMLYMDLAKSFGKGAGYGCGLLILPYIFFPMLAFGDAEYVGPVAAQ